jgi:hypothetical protein
MGEHGHTDPVLGPIGVRQSMMTVEEMRAIRRAASARRLAQAIENIRHEIESAQLAVEAIGGEERHPHTFEAVQDLSRALSRLSREAGISVQAVLDGED